MKTKNILRWGGCILITAFMILVSYVWKDFCNNYYCNGAHCFFIQNRLRDIIQLSTGIIWEELVFRLLPFLTASILITISKQKWIRYFLYGIFSIVIVCIQLEFGVLHYNVFEGGSYIKPIIIHGIMGLILTMTYTITLIVTLKTDKKNKNQCTKKSKIKDTITANIIACICSLIVHATSNVILVFTQTF